MSLPSDLKELRAALRRYEELDAQRSKEMTALYEEAENSGDYRNADYARSDWAETMDEAGQWLAAEVSNFLEKEVPNK